MRKTSGLYLSHATLQAAPHVLRAKCRKNQRSLNAPPLSSSFRIFPGDFR
jgi:hypothetical protein